MLAWSSACPGSTSASTIRYPFDILAGALLAIGTVRLVGEAFRTSWLAPGAVKTVLHLVGPTQLARIVMY